MAKKEKTVRLCDNPVVRRKDYLRPKLTEFGPVGTLTQGGMSGLTEMGMGMGENRML